MRRYNFQTSNLLYEMIKWRSEFENLSMREWTASVLTISAEHKQKIEFMPLPEDEKTISLLLDEHTHTEIKKRSAELHQSMKAIIYTTLMSYIENTTNNVIKRSFRR